MADCIDREAVMTAVQNIRRDCALRGEDVTNISLLYKKIREIPVETARVVIRGRWRIYEGQMSCENCKSEAEEATPFCPWCGADMRSAEALEKRR